MDFSRSGNFLIFSNTVPDEFNTKKREEKYERNAKNKLEFSITS